MDALDLFWLLGQSLSIVALAWGAYLSIMAAKPFRSLFETGPPDVPARPHEPLNHRLRLEAEW